ncbi:MAG: hypothetical protein WBD40_19625 [Tepidisphaeraceae bacterium]
MTRGVIELAGVIRSFGDDETRTIFDRRRSRRLPPDIQQVALRKLRMLNRAVDLRDLRIPPANRLERLRETAPANGAFESTTSGGSVSAGKRATRSTSRSWIITRSNRHA